MEEEKTLSFEHEVLNKLVEITERLTAFGRQVAKLEERTHQLGVACGMAFQQVKTVVEHLTEAVDGTRQDLAEYGGTITESTWDIDPFNR